MAEALDQSTVRAAAKAIAAKLLRALDDPHQQSIVLTRDEALLAQGIVEGVIEQLDREAR